MSAMQFRICDAWQRQYMTAHCQVRRQHASNQQVERTGLHWKRYWCPVILCVYREAIPLEDLLPKPVPLVSNHRNCQIDGIFFRGKYTELQFCLKQRIFTVINEPGPPAGTVHWRNRHFLAAVAQKLAENWANALVLGSYAWHLGSQLSFKQKTFTNYRSFLAPHRLEVGHFQWFLRCSSSLKDLKWLEEKTDP